MNITSLDVSKKLKRYGLIQGNSEYHHAKRRNSSVYDIQYKTEMRIFSIDGLLWWEVTNLAVSLGFSSHEIAEIREQKTADEQALILLQKCKEKKIKLDFRPPVTIAEQQTIF